MIEILYSYVTILCFLRQLFQELPAQVGHALGSLGGYAVPTGLALATLIRWFEGPTTVDRIANQRSVLRGLAAALAAWGLATVGGLAWKQGLSDPGWEQVVADWICWHGPPYPSPAAAVGFAMAATLWRRDWYWGLGYCLAAGLWAIAQVCCCLRYPMDVICGTVIGAGLAWLLGSIGWLNRPLDALIHLARRLVLA